jgi:membrane-bound serine protease (ClpP class)
MVYVVTLRGKLGTPELARCHRAIRDAESLGIGYVVFRCDLDTGTQTEDASDLQSLFDHVQRTKVGTVTLISGRATQGAAYLALCTDKAFCMPGAQFGEITKPEQDWDELLAADPGQLMKHRLEGVREALQSRLDARKTKLRPDAMKMAMAMADPRMQLVQATVREGGIERSRVLEVEEITALQASGATVLAQEKLSRPLMVDARTAEDAGLTQGTIQSLEQLCTDVLGYSRDAYVEVQDNWAENMVGWLEMMQSFLLIGGFLLILFEVKTPGFGLPGLLGASFLGLAMFHSYLVGLADATEIVVFFLGLIAIGVEIFVLPGTVIFGAVGFLCLVLSLVLSQQSFVWPHNAIQEEILLDNLVHLTVQFVAVLVLGAVLWRVLPSVPWFNRVLLPAPDMAGASGGVGGGSGLGLADAALTALVGQVGTAVTVLRPTGTMDLDGERIDVVTEGEFVEPGVAIRVLYVQGNRVVVAAQPTVSGERSGERGNVGVVLLLAVVGLALLVAEVFFVSFGIIATLSGCALIGAVFLAFQDSTVFGVTTLVGEAIATPLVMTFALKMLPKTRIGKELILAGPEIAPHAAAADPSLAALLHQTGVTLSPLRPAGFARIDGKKIDVVTRGEMLDADCPIKVLEVTGNRVVVGRS